MLRRIKAWASTIQAPLDRHFSQEVGLEELQPEEEVCAQREQWLEPSPWP